MDLSLPSVLAWSQFGLLGMFGGLASYFWPPSTDMRFEWKLFLGKLVISFFLGKVAAEFIAVDYTYRSGLIPVLGFFAHPVLGIIEIKVKDWVSNVNPPGAQ